MIIWNYHPAQLALITKTCLTVFRYFSAVVPFKGSSAERGNLVRATRKGKLRTCQRESPIRLKHRNENAEEIIKPSGDHFHLIYFYTGNTASHQLIPVPAMTTLSHRQPGLTQIIWRKLQAVPSWLSFSAVSHSLFNFIESRLLLY